MMINTILSDLSWVILFPKDENYAGALNDLHRKLVAKHGHYNFHDFYQFNEKLLDFYQSLKGKYSVNIFTTGVVQNHPQARERLEPIFDNIFSGHYLKLDKESSGSFLVVAKKLGRVPAEILFIDDQERFVKAAKEAGLTTLLFDRRLDLPGRIREILKGKNGKNQNN